MMKHQPLKYAWLAFGEHIQLGDDLSQEEWDEALERHRQAMIAKLRSIFRKEIVVTPEQRTSIENAAHGIWYHDQLQAGAVHLVSACLSAT